MRLYEYGKIYNYDSKGKINEMNVLSGVISGKNFESNLKNERKNLDFLDLKGDLLSIINDIKFGLSPKSRDLDESVQLALFQDGKRVGFAGAISSSLKKQYDLFDEIFYFELFMDDIKFKNTIRYKDFSRFPKIKRDLSLNISANVSVEEILNCIRKCPLKYMINSRISDIFYNKDNKDELNSITVELIFQSFTETLTDDQINTQMSSLMKTLRTQLDMNI